VKGINEIINLVQFRIANYWRRKPAISA